MDLKLNLFWSPSLPRKYRTNFKFLKQTNGCWLGIDASLTFHVISAVDVFKSQNENLSL